LRYAGFWQRVFSYLIDAVLVGGPSFAIVYFGGEVSRFFYAYWAIPGLLLGLWFHVYLVVRFGGTPGKLLMKIKIAMLDGSPITQKAAVLRYAVLLVLSLLSVIAVLIATWQMTDAEYFSFSYLERSKALMALAPAWYATVSLLMQIWIWGEFVTMLFNKKRRAVHDFIAGTVVIRNSTSIPT
jgi:uncharacterized RDD family membrane protein YckC